VPYRSGGAGEPLATVLVPTLNGGAIFRRVLSGIVSQRTDFDFDLLVVDSGSADGTDALAAKAGARVVRIAKSEFNHGLTRNRGIAESRGEFVALLTQDAVPIDDGWLSPLIDVFRRDERVAGVYCRQVPRPDCNPLSRERLRRWTATRPDPVVQEPCTAEEWERLPPMERLMRIAFDDVASSVRKSAWRRFPYEKRSFGEDLAWGKSVILGGWRIVFEPRSAVEHSHNNGPWYELRRLYSDHDNLRKLVGLRLIPDLRALLRESVHGPGHYCKAILADGLVPPVKKLPWMLYSPIFCWAELLGQYLGGKSERFIEKYPGFKNVDRLLRDGV
jgi:rhamnosyltransferase